MITPLLKIQKSLQQNGLDAVVISSVSSITYLTNYSGFSKEEREAYLFITNNSQSILTDERYTTTVKKLIPYFKLIEISSKFPLPKALKNLKTKYKIKKLGIDENNLTVREFNIFRKIFSNISHYGDIHSLRSIKTKEEITKIENACMLGDKTFDYILKKIKLGVSEKEIATEIEFFIKKHGADVSFAPIVAFGKNSAIPHHVPTNNELANNQTVLLDFGAKLNNYCSDMTRTVFFGKSTRGQKEIYQTVLSAQSYAINYLKSLIINHKSIFAKDVDHAARDYIISKGYKTIPHSLGHGIGIEIHESPRLSPKSKEILREGMVFSIEPGIYIPNSGGVRIEDLVALTKTGPKLLTHSPKNLIEL